MPGVQRIMKFLKLCLGQSRSPGQAKLEEIFLAISTSKKFLAENSHRKLNLSVFKLQKKNEGPAPSGIVLSLGFKERPKLDFRRPAECARTRGLCRLSGGCAS